MSEEKYAWVIERCLESAETSPSALLEELMGDERCAAFGPVHHVLVGAALLTCLRNAQGVADREALAEELAAFAAQAASVPGAACARWGVCGAAISAGMAYALVNGNAPLSRGGWSENQLMVSRIAGRIARSGRARCCKRDSRIAAAMAAEEFSRTFGVELPAFAASSPCAVSGQNTVCEQGACPFHEPCRS